jgi:serine/threonine-protein kinase
MLNYMFILICKEDVRSVAITRIYDSIVKKEPIVKGWSEDKKYCVTITDGTKYLLRITPISRYETRKSLFAMLKQVETLDLPMCVPVEFGTCDDGVYSIQSWIDGEDLIDVLPSLSEAEQYALGFKSGEIVRKMHTIPAPEKEIDFLPYKEDWAERFNRKADRNIKLYQDCEHKINGGEYFIRYIDQNRNLLENRSQCFQHGDYHVGNMMFADGGLKIIDFDRYDFGDPWEEFNRIVWSAQLSPYFATGQLKGYFGEDPPLKFFKLLAFYISSNALASGQWAATFGQDEFDTMTKQTQEILEWFDNMRNPVPSWYLKDLCVQWVKDTAICLTKPFDFSFLEKYGTILKVVKNGWNLCFCAEDNGKKYFIKFAGAPKKEEFGLATIEESIGFLKEAKQIYQDLAHENLIKLIKSEEAGGGYVNIFEWVDAECIGYPSPPSRQKFLNLPVEAKMRAFDDILDFHAHVAEKGYVAIDFYADQILYDFENGKTIICVIDFYQKSPYYGDKGTWGSSNFVSPEECVPGLRVDEITMVYTMGATAFSIFADYDRSPEAWTLNTALYDVAKKAVSDDRGTRQQSIEQFITEWRAMK